MAVGRGAARRLTPKAEPLSASSVNHRLRAIANLWTVLDGRHAPNPARDVPELLEPDHPPRALSYPVLEAILAEWSDAGRWKRSAWPCGGAEGGD